MLSVSDGFLLFTLGSAIARAHATSAAKSLLRTELTDHSSGGRGKARVLLGRDADTRYDIYGLRRPDREDEEEKSDRRHQSRQQRAFQAWKKRHWKKPRKNRRKGHARKKGHAAPKKGQSIKKGHAVPKKSVRKAHFNNKKKAGKKASHAILKKTKKKPSKAHSNKGEESRKTIKMEDCGSANFSQVRVAADESIENDTNIIATDYDGVGDDSLALFGSPYLIMGTVTLIFACALVLLHDAKKGSSRRSARHAAEAEGVASDAAAAVTTSAASDDAAPVPLAKEEKDNAED